MTPQEQIAKLQRQANTAHAFAEAASQRAARWSALRLKQDLNGKTRAAVVMHSDGMGFNVTANATTRAYLAAHKAQLQRMMAEDFLKQQQALK